MTITYFLIACEAYIKVINLESDPEFHSDHHNSDHHKPRYHQEESLHRHPRYLYHHPKHQPPPLLSAPSLPTAAALFRYLPLGTQSGIYRPKTAISRWRISSAPSIMGLRSRETSQIPCYHVVRTGYH